MSFDSIWIRIFHFLKKVAEKVGQLLTHLRTSRNVGFVPVLKMPIRKTLPEMGKMSMSVAILINWDNISFQTGRSTMVNLTGMTIIVANGI